MLLLSNVSKAPFLPRRAEVVQDASMKTASIYKGLILHIVIQSVGFVLAAEAYSAPEPQPSPLFGRSLSESIERMDARERAETGALAPIVLSPPPTDIGDSLSRRTHAVFVETVGPMSTCAVPSCEPAPTCARWYLTCQATCSAPTCGKEMTCMYFNTCDGATTCSQQQACPGVTTCDSQPGCALCSCPKQGDLNGNGSYDIADLLGLIRRVYFYDRPARHDSSCPHSDRADLSCDGEHSIIDIVLWVDYVWRKIPNAICDPCAQTVSH